MVAVCVAKLCRVVGVVFAAVASVVAAAAAAASVRTDVWSLLKP